MHACDALSASTLHHLHIRLLCGIQTVMYVIIVSNVIYSHSAYLRVQQNPFTQLGAACSCQAGLYALHPVAAAVLNGCSCRHCEVVAQDILTARAHADAQSFSSVQIQRLAKHDLVAFVKCFWAIKWKQIGVVNRIEASDFQVMFPRLELHWMLAYECVQ